MANTQNFNGGATGTSPGLTNNTPNTYVTDSVTWNPGNQNLYGNTQVYIDSISAYNASGSFVQKIRDPQGNDHGAGDMVYDSSGSAGWVRLYDNSSSQLTFYKTNLTSYAVNEYRQSDNALLYTWSNQALVGNYQWTTVPSAPADIQVTGNTGQVISGTYSNSSSAGGSTITGYRMQYRSSSDGSSWSGWSGSTKAVSGNTWSYSASGDGLTPGYYYQFRVFSENNIGSVTGQSYPATTGTVFMTAGGKRWTGSVWQSTSTAKRWNGSAWVDLTTAKRWNGSSWVNLG